MPSETSLRPKPAAPPNVSKSPVENAPSPPAKKSRRFPLFPLLLILGIGAALSFFFRPSRFETTDDAFIEGHILAISPKVSAQVLAVHIDDNSEVKKGDLLVDLDPRDFQVGVEKARAQIALAQAQSAQAKAQVLQAKAQLLQASAQAAQAKAQFDIAQINFSRSNGLYQKDLRAIAKQDVDTTRSSVDAAQAAREAAEANVESSKAAAVAAESQVQAAAATMLAVEVQLRDAELQLSYTKIVAPEDGRVTRKSVEPGTYVQTAQTLFSLVPHEVWVVANFKETQLARMHAGQPAEIRIDAWPKRPLKAHVESLQKGTGSRFSLLPPENATGNFVKVVQRVPVKILFDEPADVVKSLAPGESVEAKVEVQSAAEKSPAPF